MKEMDWTSLVRKLLDDLMLSQSELARLCSVSQQSVSNWRNGKREPEVYAKRKLLQIFQENSMKLYNQELSTAEEKTTYSIQPDAPTTTVEKKAGSYPQEFIDIFEKMPASKQRELSEIARRKKAEDELKLSRLRYRLLAETSSDMICTLGIPDLKIHSPSPLLCRTCGLRPEIVKKLTLFDLAHPGDFKEIEELKKRLFKNISVSPLQFRFKCKNKKYSWVEISTTPVLATGNNTSETIAVIRNISERKNAEAESMENEERFRLIAENSSDVISILSTDQILLYVSPSSQQLFGMNPSQMIGHKQTSFILSEDRIPLERTLEKAVKAKTSVHCEYRIEIKNKKETEWVESAYRYVKGFINQFNDVIICVTRNISRRKEAENVLEYREKLLSASNTAAALMLSSGRIDAVPQTLPIMASVLNADTASIFEFHTHRPASNACSIARTAFWGKPPNDKPSGNNKELANILQTFPRWLKYLKAKKAIRGTVSKFPPAEKVFLDKFGIKAITAIPVFNEKEIWGAVVFTKNSADQKWSEAEFKILKNYTGTISSYISRCKSQNIILENEMKFRIIAENMPVMMWMADKDGNVIYSNGKTNEFLLGSRENPNITSASWKERVHPDDYEKWQKTFSFSFKSHKKFKLEYRLRRNDGKFRWVLDFGSPLFSRSEKFSGFLGACVDITERKLVEEMLSQSEQKLNLLMNSTATGIWEIDLEQSTVSFCERTAALLSYPPRPGTLKIKKLSEYIHPEDLRTAREKLVRHIHNIYLPLSIDLRIKDNDSSWRWMQVRGKVVSKNKRKRPAFIMGSIHDISEEKMSEHILRDSEIRYRELFNSMNSGAVTLRRKKEAPTFIINDINKAGMKITAISSKKEIIGKSIAKVFEGLKNTPLPAALEEMSQKNNYAKLPPFLYKDRNSEFWADSYIYMLPSGETVWGFSDISEQLNTLKALKRSEEKYSGILKSANDPIFIIDFKTLEVLECNNQAWKTLHYPKHLLIGKKYSEIVPEYRKKYIPETIKTLEEKGSLDCHESVMLNSEGKEIHVELSGNIFEIDGKKAIICIARDISERKKVQELREDFEKLSRHDLKSPLNFIINAPEIVKETSKDLSKDTLQILDMIENSAKKMLDTINLSIGLHRLEDGSFNLKKEPVDIAILFENICEEQEVGLRVKSCRIQFNINGENLLIHGKTFVCVERLTFSSMLGNLIKNAIEASPEKSVIKIEFTSGQNGKTEISIQNKGEVPEDIKDKFFVKYITSGKPFGTGLGTYYAKLIADAHKATITMKSSKADGTTVTLQLPD